MYLFLPLEVPEPVQGTGVGVFLTGAGEDESVVVGEVAVQVTEDGEGVIGVVPDVEVAMVGEAEVVEVDSLGYSRLFAEYLGVAS